MARTEPDVPQIAADAAAAAGFTPGNGNPALVAGIIFALCDVLHSAGYSYADSAEMLKRVAANVATMEH